MTTSPSEQPPHLHTHCQKCKNKMPDGCIYYKHPKYGIVCEFCNPFKDGGLEPVEELEDDDDDDYEDWDDDDDDEEYF